jgi:hypothetical protein
MPWVAQSPDGVINKAVTAISRIESRQDDAAAIRKTIRRTGN